VRLRLLLCSRNGSSHNRGSSGHERLGGGGDGGGGSSVAMTGGLSSKVYDEAGERHIEEQNDRAAEELSARVQQLKDITVNISAHIKEDNRLLENEMVSTECDAVVRVPFHCSG
jgi:hypothetical protein